MAACVIPAFIWSETQRNDTLTKVTEPYSQRIARILTDAAEVVIYAKQADQDAEAQMASGAKINVSEFQNKLDMDIAS